MFKFAQFGWLSGILGTKYKTFLKYASTHLITYLNSFPGYDLCTNQLQQGITQFHSTISFNVLIEAQILTVAISTDYYIVLLLHHDVYVVVCIHPMYVCVLLTTCNALVG